MTRFRRRRCAQDVRIARRLNPKVFDAVSCTPALSLKLLQALGACRAAKLRRKSSNLSRFQPKITVFECKILRQKASLSSGQAAHLVHRASNDRRCHPCAFVREFMAAMGQITADFQNIERKIARISITKLRDFGAEGACKT